MDGGMVPLQRVCACARNPVVGWPAAGLCMAMHHGLVIGSEGCHSSSGWSRQCGPACCSVGVAAPPGAAAGCVLLVTALP
jgi:hypothetical protein